MSFVGGLGEKYLADLLAEEFPADVAPDKRASLPDAAAVPPSLFLLFVL